MKQKANNEKRADPYKEFEGVVFGYFFNTLFYRKTKNPLFLWQAYQICRKEKFVIPEWIYKYFDDCAGKILIKKDPKDKAASLCYEAFGFKSKGPGTQWEKVQHIKKKWKSYIQVKQEEESLSQGSRTEILERTIEKLGEESRSEVDMSTLNRWLRDIKSTFQNKDEVDSIFNEMRELFPKV